MSSPEYRTDLNNLEYWLMKPFSPLKDADVPYIKMIIGSIQSLQTNTPHGEEYDNTLSMLEAAYQEQKMKYQYVERRQTEKAILKMKSTVINRMISQRITPITNKVVSKVGPVVSKTFNETVIPAADKTLRFLHKMFAKKKTEEVAVSNNPTVE